MCVPRFYPPLSSTRLDLVIYPRISHWRVSLGFSYALFFRFRPLAWRTTPIITRLWMCVHLYRTYPLPMQQMLTAATQKCRQHRASSLNPTGKGKIVPLFYLSATELRTGSPIAVSLVRAREAETLPRRQGTRTSE